MNKRQLIVAWITGIIICLICLHPPTYYYGHRRADLVRTILYIIPILILGVLTIFSLHDDNLIKQAKKYLIKIKGYLKSNSKKIQRIARREAIILFAIFLLGLLIGLSSRLFPPTPKLHSISESISMLSDSELKNMDLCLNKVVAYCATHPEIKLYGFNTGNPEIDRFVMGDTLSILDISAKMAKENPDNQKVHEDLKTISEKISQGGKNIDWINSVSAPTVENKRTFLTKVADRISHFIGAIFRRENIINLAVLIMILGYPICLFVRLAIKQLRR